MQTTTPLDAHTERMSCPARLQEPEKQQEHEAKKEKKLSRFFHTLAHKLKLSSSPEDDRESLLKHLGFALDFVAVVQGPSVHLFKDATVCLQRLSRVKDVFVRSKEEVKDVGTVVHIEVTLKSHNVPVQGIFHPGKTSTTYVLTRPFEECRKLLKVIEFCVSRKQHELRPNESKEDGHPLGQTEKPCTYCAEVGLYAKRCWTQPPLMATAVFSQMAIFRKIVLTNSLNYFIHLARAQYPAATTNSDSASLSDNVVIANPSSEDASATNADGERPDSSQQQEPATTPFCQAQAELVILLNDFFQLQTHA